MSQHSKSGRAQSPLHTMKEWVFASTSPVVMNDLLGSDTAHDMRSEQIGVYGVGDNIND